jgi:hypothetical protein
MRSPDLPQEAAELLRSASRLLHSASQPRRGASQPLRGAGAPVTETLGELVRLAASQVTGCSGASAALWQDREPAVFAASYPDLADLARVERSAGCGPVTEARATGKPVCSPDTLGDDRWPAYNAAALARGVRSWITLVHQSGPVVVTLSLFGTLPGLPGPAGRPPGAIGS